jgi:hypothetical protein
MSEVEVRSYLLRQFAVARVLLSTAIFVFLKKKHKGFPFQSGLGHQGKKKFKKNN